MKRIALLTALVLMLTGAGLSSSGVELAFFRVERDGNDFAVSWQADVEGDVREYELYRKASYSDVFSKVYVVEAQGAGTVYRFNDDQVYKAVSEEVEYRLDVVLNSGERQNVSGQRLSYTPTAIRRTWGSIKAMFQ